MRELHILRCTGLEDEDPFGGNDPFVIVRCGTNPETELYRTPVVEEVGAGEVAKWADASVELGTRTSVILMVMDKDVTDDDFLGRCRIDDIPTSRPAGEEGDAEEAERKLQLFRNGDDDEKEPAGRLVVRFSLPVEQAAEAEEETATATEEEKPTEEPVEDEEAPVDVTELTEEQDENRTTAGDESGDQNTTQQEEPEHPPQEETVQEEPQQDAPQNGQDEPTANDEHQEQDGEPSSTAPEEEETVVGDQQPRDESSTQPGEEEPETQKAPVPKPPPESNGSPPPQRSTHSQSNKTPTASETPRSNAGTEDTEQSPKSQHRTHRTGHTRHKKRDEEAADEFIERRNKANAARLRIIMERQERGDELEEAIDMRQEVTKFNRDAFLQKRVLSNRAKTITSLQAARQKRTENIMDIREHLANVATSQAARMKHVEENRERILQDMKDRREKNSSSRKNGSSSSSQQQQPAKAKSKSPVRLPEIKTKSKYMAGPTYQPQQRSPRSQMSHNSGYAMPPNSKTTDNNMESSQSPNAESGGHQRKAATAAQKALGSMSRQ